MTVHSLPGMPGDGEDTTKTIVKMAILAVGGQGGGVLTDWIIAVAESNGYRAQATSVAGVAQRTGATIYYVEMVPDAGRDPVFSLSPAPGDVDILIAAELMEAGRAMMRGFVTPDRTTLIASAHRVLAVSEKIVPGDGRSDFGAVAVAAAAAARNFVCFDMERIAVDAGSVISASLFGALAGSGALPFPRATYEETIKESGRGVKASLAAFSASYERAQRGSAATDGEDSVGDADAPTLEPSGPPEMMRAWQELLTRLAALPAPVQDMARAGLRKVVDFQDTDYGRSYLDHLDRAIRSDDAAHDYRFSVEVAKYVAGAMTYDDVIRVADLKTRSARARRVRSEMQANDETVLNVTEYFHPRMEEVCGTMPVALGRWIEGRPKLFAWLDRRVNKGRHIRTDSITGFASLWMVSSMRRWRRALLRHKIEMEHLERWLALALRCREKNYHLGVEVVKCRRLIKGYSDTHARGLSKFDRVLSGLDMLRDRDDAADWLRRLREAALLDEDGAELDGALKTVATL